MTTGALLSLNELAQHPAVCVVSIRAVASAAPDWHSPLIARDKVEAVMRAAVRKGSDVKIRLDKRRTLFIRLEHDVGLPV
jgi:hypothetical protein